ncbi:MAG TPA: hypothetical protein VFK85_13635 [Anaeromyxobacteraceae bacterium]|nr:hypothetical protein [Anaeromyxobacteraceae bacterium]
MSEDVVESVVRIRYANPADAERCRAMLRDAGLEPEDSLTWLVVRQANPDAVNAVLVGGGALGRVVVREQIGKLVGWLIDRQGDLAGRSRNVKSLVERVVSDAGLKDRYEPRDEATLLAEAEDLHEQLMASGAAMVTWDAFVARFLRPRGPG